MAKMASEAAMLTEVPMEYNLGFRDGLNHAITLLRQLAKDYALIEGDDSHDAAYHNHLADVLEEDNKWE